MKRVLEAWRLLDLETAADQEADVVISFEA